MKTTRIILICGAFYGAVSQLDYEAALALQHIRCDQSDAPPQCFLTADAGSRFDPAEAARQLLATAAR